MRLTVKLKSSRQLIDSPQQRVKGVSEVQDLRKIFSCEISIKSLELYFQTAWNVSMLTSLKIPLNPRMFWLMIKII